MVFVAVSGDLSSTCHPGSSIRVALCGTERSLGTPLCGKYSPGSETASSGGKVFINGDSPYRHSELNVVLAECVLHFVRQVVKTVAQELSEGALVATVIEHARVLYQMLADVSWWSGNVASLENASRRALLGLQRLVILIPVGVELLATSWLPFLCGGRTNSITGHAVPLLMHGQAHQLSQGLWAEFNSWSADVDEIASLHFHAFEHPCETCLLSHCCTYDVPDPDSRPRSMVASIVRRRRGELASVADVSCTASSQARDACVPAASTDPGNMRIQRAPRSSDATTILCAPSVEPLVKSNKCAETLLVGRKPLLKPSAEVVREGAVTVFTVVHTVVAVRAAPHSRAILLGVLTRGQSFSGKAVRGWACVDVRRVLEGMERNPVWVRIDGGEFGCGKLLRAATGTSVKASAVKRRSPEANPVGSDKVGKLVQGASCWQRVLSEPLSYKVLSKCAVVDTPLPKSARLFTLQVGNLVTGYPGSPMWIRLDLRTDTCQDGPLRAVAAEGNRCCVHGGQISQSTTYFQRQSS